MITMEPADLLSLIGAAPTASPPVADTERLLRVLEGEPEVDQCENLAEAAAAVIERLDEALTEMRKMVCGALNLIPEAALDVMVERIRELAEGPLPRDLINGLDRYAKELLAKEYPERAEKARHARSLVEDAVHDVIRHPSPTWVLIQEGERAREVVGRTPDAIHILSVGDVSADGVQVRYPATDPLFSIGNVVTVGGYLYEVTQSWRVISEPGAYAVRLRSLDGAPVRPTIDGLIARVWGNDAGHGIAPAAFHALADAIGDEGHPEMHVVGQAALLIEALKDDRAQGEQRRLDLAEKLWLPTAATWDQIGNAVALRGLLSPPVLRMAPAMQERLEANAHKPGWESDAWEDLLKRLREETAELKRALDAPFVAGSRLRIRREAADVANFAMMLAQNEGDLDGFDAAAEIAAARRDKPTAPDDEF